jgi:hypothetical protein
MAGPRFVILSDSPTEQRVHDTGERVTWMLVSSNSRPLGRAAEWFVGIDVCRNAVALVSERASELRITIAVAGSDWQWRGALDGVPVAASTRSYLRQYECDYNARRFLEALPLAQVVGGVRIVRNGLPTR